MTHRRQLYKKFPETDCKILLAVIIKLQRLISDGHKYTEGDLVIFIYFKARENANVTNPNISDGLNVHHEIELSGKELKWQWRCDSMFW